MSDDDKAMTQILDKPALSSLRAQIDSVDAELRALLKRVRFVRPCDCGKG